MIRLQDFKVLKSITISDQISGMLIADHKLVVASGDYIMIYGDLEVIDQFNL